ncbi:MAG: fructose-bisphosphatase class II family protein [Candidatus Dormibacteraeota bacterium]|nr:fructose-bisphosphatase class II family protein [Candidatus Dormibacteraeota bacterium]
MTEVGILAETPVGSRIRAVPNLVQVTEAAALSCLRLLGRGEPERVREAASAAMLAALQDLGLSGRVVLGPRGDRLSEDMRVGLGEALDLAVYPVEGSSLVARGGAGISLLAAAEPGAFPTLPAVWYVDKIVTGPAARGALDLDDPLSENLRRIALAKGTRPADLTVAILDRPRHGTTVQEIRDFGARVLLLEEGEIAGALLTATPGAGVDVLVGVGGIHEAVLAACGVQCLGGDMQARLYPRNDDERLLAGPGLDRIYRLADLAPRPVDLAVTGIGGSAVVGPARAERVGLETDSLVLSSREGTVRRIHTRHRRAGEA